MDGRAPKIEGEEPDERVFHSAKGFMSVEVSMVVFVVLFEERRVEVENGMCLEPEMENSSENVVA